MPPNPASNFGNVGRTRGVRPGAAVEKARPRCPQRAPAADDYGLENAGPRAPQTAPVAEDDGRENPHALVGDGAPGAGEAPRSVRKGRAAGPAKSARG